SKVTLYASELLLVGPQIELERPRATRLEVEHPVGVGERVDREHAVGAELLLDLRRARIDQLAVDHAVDDHVRNVHALRTELAREAVRHRALGSLRSGERDERRARA